jgi:hypothetical protein
LKYSALSSPSTPNPHDGTTLFTQTLSSVALFMCTLGPCTFVDILVPGHTSAPPSSATAPTALFHAGVRSPRLVICAPHQCQQHQDAHCRRARSHVSAGCAQRTHIVTTRSNGGVRQCMGGLGGVRDRRGALRDVSGWCAHRSHIVTTRCKVGLWSCQNSQLHTGTRSRRSLTATAWMPGSSAPVETNAE